MMARNYRLVAVVVALTLLVPLRAFINASSDLRNAIGCYEEYAEGRAYRATQGGQSVARCVAECVTAYYRYAFVRFDGGCECGNALGRRHSDASCTTSCADCEARDRLVDAYKAASAPGPCANVRIRNVTRTGARLTWDVPRAFDAIAYYRIHGRVTHTYACTYKLYPFALTYYAGGTAVDLRALHPGTAYNVSVHAVSDAAVEGARVYAAFETEIAEPDHRPLRPRVIDANATAAAIEIAPTINNNGPISGYLVIVKRADSLQAIDDDAARLLRDDDDDDNNAAFHVAAQLSPAEIARPFVVGDGKRYGAYVNAPLDAGTRYQYVVAVRSERHGRVTYAFSDVSHAPFAADSGGRDAAASSALDAILYASIAIVSMLIAATLVAFVALRRKIASRTRQRASDNQELTLRAAIVEAENNAYVPEDYAAPPPSSSSSPSPLDYRADLELAPRI